GVGRQHRLDRGRLRLDYVVERVGDSTNHLVAADRLVDVGGVPPGTAALDLHTPQGRTRYRIPGRFSPSGCAVALRGCGGWSPGYERDRRCSLRRRYGTPHSRRPPPGVPAWDPVREGLRPRPGSRGGPHGRLVPPLRSRGW